VIRFRESRKAPGERAEKPEKGSREGRRRLRERRLEEVLRAQEAGEPSAQAGEVLRGGSGARRWGVGG